MSEIEMIGLIKKLQEQVVSLEKKIDILVNRSPERPFNQDRSSSRPFKSYDSGPRHVKGYNDHGPSKGYGDSRKEYGHKKEFDQERPFEKRPGSKPHGFNPKKKPFFKKPGFSK